MDIEKTTAALTAALKSLSPADAGAAEEWRDMSNAPHEVPIIAQYYEWNVPTRALAEHVVWFRRGSWRPWPQVTGDAYADRWKPLHVAAQSPIAEDAGTVERVARALRDRARAGRNEDSSLMEEFGGWGADDDFSALALAALAALSGKGK